MKKNIQQPSPLILLSLLIFGCTVQKIIPSEESTIEKIIEIPDRSKNELYISANSWFVETFRSAESVIQFQDKEAGKIMGKYVYFAQKGLSSIDIQQTISIDIKDNRVRVNINDPRYRLNGIAFIDYMPVNDRKTLDQVHVEWNKLIESLTSYLDKEVEW
uniref:DUF4468 domain-containing protein n=1 Tax=uncultured Draconibacterium sp. TaxID=1573823 RepID=UPI003216C0D2